MPRKSPYLIFLTDEERNRLVKIAGQYTSQYCDVTRAKTILYAAQGFDNKKIAQYVGLPRQIVSKWRKRFFEERLSGLPDKPRRGRPRAFSPDVVVQVKAVACQLPAELGIPLSRFSYADIAAEVMRQGIVASISGTTVWRWLSEDAIKPWLFRSWIWPRDPLFVEKAERVLDLYHGHWGGLPLGPRDYVISADEKTSIQARRRIAPASPPASGRMRRVEFEYERGGALAYLAAWDVHRAKVFGICERHSGIQAFDKLVDMVMRQNPYRNAKRVFWITDNGSSHRGQKAAERLRARHANLILVNTPVHASWLNQVEIYFSVLQRKVLTPNEFPCLSVLENNILAFQRYYETAAQPFEWRFTTEDLRELMEKLSTEAPADAKHQLPLVKVA